MILPICSGFSSCACFLPGSSPLLESFSPAFRALESFPKGRAFPVLWQSCSSWDLSPAVFSELSQRFFYWKNPFYQGDSCHSISVWWFFSCALDMCAQDLMFYGIL